MPATAVVLVQDGQAQATIVVPDAASPTVQLAADELARYIELISGATLPVVTEGEAAQGTTIAVGPTELPESEGIAIHVGDDGVLIQGGSDRATVFAVYRFLEELGCRWMAQDQEFVPTMTTVDVGAMDLNTAPVFNMRTFGARRENLRVWGMKMGMNGFYTAEDVDMHGAGYYLPAAAPSCHAYYLSLIHI